MPTTQGINPITVRGIRGLEDRTERCFAIGRLWISSRDSRDGQHRFNPMNSYNRALDKTMQFVIFEGQDDILAFMLGDELDFVPNMKAMIAGRSEKFVLNGESARRNSEQRRLVFEKWDVELLNGFQPLFVSIYHRNIESQPISQVLLDYNHFCNGLKHLFVQGELLK